MTDMSVDSFASFPFGKVALEKMGETPINFRLYDAGIVGDPKNSDTMKVTGAEFRLAKSGKNKGVLSIKIPNTTRIVYVTRAETAKYDL